mgnify:FL=1
MTSPPASAVPIAITGVGLRTPIGTTALQTTTSVPAGLNRFREWPHLGLDLGEDGPGLPTASAIAGLGDATWQDKADALARPAVEEALHAARWFRASDLVNAHGREAVALYLAAPYPMDASVPDCEAGLDAVGDAIGDFVVGLGEIPSVAHPFAHASGIRCIAAPMRHLHEQRIDVAIV